MAFTWQRDINIIDQAEVDFIDPAYAGAVGGERSIPWNGISANGRYAFGGRLIETMFVADLEAVNLLWSHDFNVSGNDFGGTGFEPMCIDDEATVWGRDHSSGASVSDDIYSSDGADQLTLEYSITNDGGLGSTGKRPVQMFAFTMPDASIKLVIFPTRNHLATSHEVFLATKGTPGLTEIDLSSAWLPSWAFQDNNGDIWVAGAPHVAGDTGRTTLILQRLTNVTGTSPYATPISATVPDLTYSGSGTAASPVGFYKSGHFVGGWAIVRDCEHLVRINLTTGAVATTRTLETEVRMIRHTPPDPDKWFVIPTEDLSPGESNNSRVFRELNMTTLADTGTEYNLDQWETGGQDGLVETEWYVDSLFNTAGIGAFLGQEWWQYDPNFARGELWIYYFSDIEGDAGVGDGLQDTSVRLRVWGYGLDGHKHIVWRLGPSETLVFDPTTRQWSSFESPGRTNWRAHVGQNWVGMSADTLANGFGSDIVAGDDASGVLWILDPTAGRDDRSDTGSDPFDRVVTGGLSLSGREVVACGALQLDFSTGNPTQEDATFTLETSDNWGNSFDSHGSVSIVADDHGFASVEWRGLGQARAPGRVFRITDNGAAVRLSYADLR